MAHPKRIPDLWRVRLDRLLDRGEVTMAAGHPDAPRAKIAVVYPDGRLHSVLEWCTVQEWAKRHVAAVKAVHDISWHECHFPHPPVSASLLFFPSERRNPKVRLDGAEATVNWTGESAVVWRWHLPVPPIVQRLDTREVIGSRPRPDELVYQSAGGTGSAVHRH